MNRTKQTAERRLLQVINRRIVILAAPPFDELKVVGVFQVFGTANGDGKTVNTSLDLLDELSVEHFNGYIPHYYFPITRSLAPFYFQRIPNFVPIISALPGFQLRHELALLRFTVKPCGAVAWTAGRKAMISFSGSLKIFLLVDCCDMISVRQRLMSWGAVTVAFSRQISA